MLTYIVRRILWMVPTLFGITVLIFCVMRMTPGDPAAAMVTDITSEGVADAGNVEAAIEKFRAKWGLDKSWPEQYWIWIQGFATLDFGEEFRPARGGHLRASCGGGWASPCRSR